MALPSIFSDKTLATLTSEERVIIEKHKDEYELMHATLLINDYDQHKYDRDRYPLMVGDIVIMGLQKIMIRIISLLAFDGDYCIVQCLNSDFSTNGSQFTRKISCLMYHVYDNIIYRKCK